MVVASRLTDRMAACRPGWSVPCDPAGRSGGARVATRGYGEGMPTPTPCSELWDEDALWGTAPPTRFWLALEQRGPWGALAFEQSRLDPQVGKVLHDEAERAGGRAVLIRRIGHQAHGPSGSPHRVFLAGGMPSGEPWLLTAVLDEPAVLTDLPWEALAAGDRAAARAALPGAQEASEPILLVCTNAKRDVCCATRGRAVATFAAERRGTQVWESSHLSGHRYAATAVTLPLGVMYGRLDGDLAVAALDAAGRGEVAEGAVDGVEAASAHLRGLAHLSPAEQAADAYARGLGRRHQAGAVSTRVLETDPRAEQVTHRVEVTDADARLTSVLDVVEHVRADRPGSCGGAPKATVTYEVRPVEEP